MPRPFKGGIHVGTRIRTLKNGDTYVFEGWVGDGCYIDKRENRFADLTRLSIFNLVFNFFREWGCGVS